jgi:hypothetical protein
MLSLFLAIALIFTMIGPSYAAVTDIVVQGAAGDTNLYQYDYAELNASYMNYLMGDTAGASLYLDFMNKTYPPVAFKDSEKGYVDYNDVSNAYMNALMSGSDWNTDNYTSTLAAPADMPPTVKATSVIGGEITTVDTPTSTTAITITAVTAIDPKTVDVGTGFKSLGLPTTNKVTYSDGTTADLAISEWGGDKYEKDIAGVYNLLAVLTLPTGVTYGEGVTGPTCKVTVVDSQAAIVAAAEGAVAAYEAAAITTAEEITAAEALEVTANEKAALVADADKKAAFEARIAAKKAAVDAAKAALVKLVVSSVSAINANKVLAGATDIRVNETFKVTFSKAVDASTAVSANFELKSGSTVAPTNVALSADKKVVTVTPVNNLEILKDYTLTVKANVKEDGAETTLGQDSVTSFKTADAVVVTNITFSGKTLEQAPFVVGDITAGAGIVMTFNKDLDAATVNTTNVKLYNVTDGTYVPAAVNKPAYTAATKAIDFLASAAQPNKIYEIRVNGVQALDGTTVDNYKQQFSIGIAAAITLSVPNGITGVNDVYPGLTGKTTIQATTPAVGGDTERTFNPFKVSINFKRAMDAATVKVENVRLFEIDANGIEKAGTDVAGTLTYDAASYSATFIPNADLKESTSYKFVASKNIKDAANIAIAEASLTFKTGDFTAPTVATTNVADGTRLAQNKPLNITFSEPMYLARFVAVAAGANDFSPTASVKLVKNNAPATAIGLAAFAIDPADTTGKTISFIATGGWAVNTTYTLTIKGKNYDGNLAVTDNAKDATPNQAGNMMASDFSVTFTTADTSVPQVVAVKGFAAGYTGTTPNVDLAGSTPSSYVSGLNEANTTGVTAADEAIWIYFNRVVNGGFLDIANYTLTKDGAGNLITAPTALAAGFVAAIQQDTNGKNTIVKLVPSEKTGGGNDAGTVIAGEHKYVLTIKKDTATTDTKKLVEDVKVYFTTMVNPQAIGVTPLQTNDGGFAAVATDVTTAVYLNKGLQINFAKIPAVGTINATNIKIEDLTASKTLTGIFYETQAKDLLPTTGVATDTDVWFFPADDSNKFVAGHQYKVTIANVTDEFFNAMKAPYIAYFTVKDTAAPKIVSVSVENGAEGVSVEPTFTVTFSKAVTNGDTAGKITLGAIPITVTMSADKKTATITPLVYLAKLTTYTLHIDKTITDGTTEIGMDTDIAFTTENVTKTAAIQSAVWNATAKTLTITLDKPVKAGKTVVIGDIITSATFGTTPAVSTSMDRKTIVVQADTAAGVVSVIPSVHAVSLKTNGNAVLSDDSNYKQNIDTVGNQIAANSITIQ